jgi:hypothetical protein
MSHAGGPFFLITIDTEGDNLWARPKQIETRNSRYLPRFQELCERYGFKPTYLTNYEMANCPDFQAFARDVVRRRTGEIGMHLHAWNSPPLIPLTENDYFHQPFLIEYPERIMREKVVFLTKLLEDTFGIKMRSHRAGRWAFNSIYARMLVENAYDVDCSVTPLVSWRQTKGDPQQNGGPDYRDYPPGAYFVDTSHIGRPGDSTLLEAPMTIVSRLPNWARRVREGTGSGSLPGRVMERLYPSAAWLRPNGTNLGNMLRLLEHTRAEGRQYVEFMLHSSEFMPGGSPVFPAEESIEHLYEHLEKLFQAASRTYQGATLTEFRDACRQALPQN